MANIKGLKIKAVKKVITAAKISWLNFESIQREIAIPKTYFEQCAVLLTKAFNYRDYQSNASENNLVILKNDN
jgi:hypothetical protein